MYRGLASGLLDERVDEPPAFARPRELLARGIHPPALDSGLAIALETLAARAPLPVTLTGDPSVTVGRALLVRVADRQTVLDPEVVRQLFGATGGRDGGLERLTAREREVLELMAQGRSNGAIADALHLSCGAVEKNVAAIFTKLDLEPDAADHRRVLAVLRYLGA